MGIIDFFLWLVIGFLPAVAIAVLSSQVSATQAVEGWFTFGARQQQTGWTLEFLWPVVLRLSLSAALGHVLAGSLGSMFDSLALLLRATLVVGVSTMGALFIPTTVLYVYEGALQVFTVLALGLQSLVLFSAIMHVSYAVHKDFVTDPKRGAGAVALIIISALVSLVVVLCAFWSFSQLALEVNQAVWATIATTITIGTVLLGFGLRRVKLFDAIFLCLFNTLLITQHSSAAGFLTVRFGCHVALWVFVVLAAQLRHKVKTSGLVHFGLALVFAAETYVAGNWLGQIAELPSFWYIVQSLLNCLLCFLFQRPTEDHDDHDD